ncbi:hypothetical protein BD311DRAFT_811448 [Dichomitus squalens]|uniref:Uncharacterized protein n=1 Tax=Dichomitus squalens TaxID=114155 RepID=A0A4Q9MA16_9APHY|nr:hypothetical protein BD311DRAFT_811448 [Dichomitus squalens]
MTESVPNEILELILRFALQVPTPTFEAWRTQRTFCGSPRSTVSDLLVVSKRWCAAGTPALYESAILRSPHQVTALASQLNASSRSKDGLKLGRYLRRLRIEGGYDGAFIKVLNAAPGITDLFLCYDLSNKDSMAGLIRAFRKISPERLFLDTVKGNGASDHVGINLSKAIGGALPTWKKLKYVTASDLFVFWPDLLREVPKFPALEHISLSSRTATTNIDGNNLEHLARIPTLKIIQIRTMGQFATPLLLHKHADPRAKELIYLGVGKHMVKLTEYPDVEVTLENPPSLPELPDKLWDKILGYATHVHDPEFLDVDEETFHRSCNWPSVASTRKAVLLLSKRFHRLGLRHMYSIPHLKSENAVETFIARVEASDELARLVRVFFIPRRVELKAPKRISAPLISLMRVDRRVRVFPDITRNVERGGAFLLESMEQDVGQDVIDPSVWAMFANLKNITLYGRCSALEGVDIPALALPTLEVLELWGCDVSMLGVFARMRHVAVHVVISRTDLALYESLPSLRQLGFSAVAAPDAVILLEVHGAKLDSLAVDMREGAGAPSVPVLDHCPRINELRIITTTAVPLGIPFLTSSQPHTSIRRLTFPSLILDRIRNFSAKAEEWDSFIDQLTEHRAKLPNLKEFCILEPFQWPVN